MPTESRQFLGADKAHHTRELVVQNTGKPGGWTIDARTTRHEGHAPTLKIRKLIETAIGWMKDIGGGLRKAKLDGLATCSRAPTLRICTRRPLEPPENRQLRIEREILSKATAWFARETGSIPSRGSNS